MNLDTRDLDRVRERIQIEDELLNSRTTIFLATNGLWAAAVGFGDELHIRMGIGILGALVSIMWVMCSWQSWKVIRRLTICYEKTSTDPIQKVVRCELWSTRYRPTNILAKWLPILFVSAWVVFLVWLIGTSL